MAGRIAGIMCNHHMVAGQFDGAVIALGVGSDAMITCHCSLFSA
jgi:hypothetical protein